MINEAIAKITDEMMKNPNDGAIVAIEEYLTSICTTEAIAGKLLTEGKTLKGALGVMESEATKRKSGSMCVCISADEGFQIVEKYFEIMPEDKAAISKSHLCNRSSGMIDITDLL